MCPYKEMYVINYEAKIIMQNSLYSLAKVEQAYTVEEAIEKMGFGFFQVIMTVFSGLLWVRCFI